MNFSLTKRKMNLSAFNYRRTIGLIFQNRNALQQQNTAKKNNLAPQVHLSPLTVPDESSNFDLLCTKNNRLSVTIILKSLSKLFFFSAIFCFTQAWAQSTKPQQIYVASTGKDSQSGTSSRPFASPQAALKQVTKLKKDGYKGAVELILREGTYYLDEALLITPAESGSENAPLTIKAAKGHRVTLSGAVPLHLKWVHQQSGIWKASTPKGLVFQELYTNGKRLHRARYPNYDATVLPFQGYAADALSTARVQRWKDPTTAYVHALHIGRWGGFHYRISGRDQDGQLTFSGGEQNNRPSKMHETYRYVENIVEELDVANEWFLDEKTNTLYYYPEKGIDPNNEQFEAPLLENIITIQGSLTQPAHNIRLEGIRFTHTAPTFMKTAEPLLRSDWTIYRQGAVKIEGAERCEVTGSDFVDLGGNAIFISNYNRDILIANNLIERLGAGAINFVGSPEAVRSPAFRYEKSVPITAMDTLIGPKSDNFPKDCEASNNLIRDIGLIEKQVAGVQISMASAIRVLHNSIYRVPRAGINIGDGTWGGHDIAYNDVFQTVLETSDHGAFNSWGRDRFWQANRGEMNKVTAQHPTWVLLDAVQPTQIRNNRFQCDHGWDIDLDDGSTNYQIYNNLCLSGGLKLREGFYRTVYNNIMINNGFHPHVWFKDSHDVFRNNVVMRSHADIQVKFWGDTVDYNYYASTDDLAKDQKKGIDAHSEVIDMQFKDAAKGDFQLVGNLPKGFKNFDMNSFGVEHPRLKKLAETAPIPTLSTQNASTQTSVLSWKGAQFKSIASLGEQSAAGLPSMAGALVAQLEENSPLYLSGLRASDVIVECQHETIDNSADLERIVKRDKFRDQLTVVIYRNQSKQTLLLKL